MTNSNLGSGGPGPRARATPAAGAGENSTQQTVGGGVEQPVRRAAQRRRLSGVSHHVREGAAWAEAGESGDCVALPAVVESPIEHRPVHQCGAQVAGLRRIDREACRRDRRGLTGGGGERRRGRRRAGERATDRLLEGGDGWSGCRAAPTCRPPRPGLSSAPAHRAGRSAY